jgi:hypothetical protein
MWKLVVGFILFAALSLFVIMKAGDKIDMGGETHSGDIGGHAPSAAASAPASAASGTQ